MVADQFVNKLTKEGKSLATLKKLHWLLEDVRKGFGYMPITAITAPIIVKKLQNEKNTAITKRQAVYAPE